MSTQDPVPNQQPPVAVPKAEPKAGSVAPKPAAATVAPVPAAPPAPVVWPNPLSHLALSFQGVDYSFRGYHAEAKITPDQVVAAAEELDREGFALDTITGVDWLAEKQFEVVYDYFHPTKPLRAVVRTRIPRDQPQVPTISTIYPGANWHERETHDFFGIEFTGHPNLTPFLLPEDATYHPLRKDFSA